MANPPAPVSEGIVVPGHSKATCDKIKAEFGVVTRTHRKGAKASTNKESHHALQDKAMKGLISKYSGWAILLSKTEHAVANSSQIARNCPEFSTQWWRAKNRYVTCDTVRNRELCTAGAAPARKFFSWLSGT